MNDSLAWLRDPEAEPALIDLLCGLVTLLAKGAGPATALFEDMAGERLGIELAGQADRPLTAAECRKLRTNPGTPGHQRTGRLRTVRSGLVAAEVSSVVVPGRLPAAARRALGIPGPDGPGASSAGVPGAAVPLGTVLAGLGVRRESLGARLLYDSTRGPGRQGCVETSARMWVDGMPVALASERVTAEFCQQAHSRLASPPDLPEWRDLVPGP